jgi:hypothetical protein
MNKLFIPILLLFVIQVAAQTRPVTSSLPTPVSPANGSVTNNNQLFTWLPPAPMPGPVTYKIKIVEILGDQSPDQALMSNKPHFEKDSLKDALIQYPSSAPVFIRGKKYGWAVQYFNKERKSSGYSKTSLFLGNAVLPERNKKNE